MSTARLAVVGLGRMGLRHARNAAASPRIELVAVADADPARADDVAAELGARAYDGADVQRLLRDERPDGVCMVIPTPAHAPLIELAAAHDVHVFCEKPLARRRPGRARAPSTPRGGPASPSRSASRCASTPTSPRWPG